MYTPIADRRTRPFFRQARRAHRQGLLDRESPVLSNLSSTIRPNLTGAKFDGATVSHIRAQQRLARRCDEGGHEILTVRRAQYAMARPVFGGR